MPGFARYDPRKDPFSYMKVCYYYLPGLLALLGMPALFISAFVQPQWLKKVGKWFPSSTLWVIVVVIVIASAYYLLAVKIFWRLLPVRIRARIPYDAREANESERDIKSLWDLVKLIVLPHPN